MEIVSHNLNSEHKEAFLKALAAGLGDRPEILFAYAHGSFLGEGRFRDLDVAIYIRREFLPKKSALYETELAGELQKALKSLFPLDIRILNTARLSFQFKAIRGRLLIDRDPEARIAFITKTLSLYLDIEPILRHYTKEVFGVESRS